jgi:ABC-type Fe3+-hydroxamate transport system substrate-binding protein
MKNKIFLDQMQRSVELTFPLKRIVSLVPSQTELLYYFGLEQEVVAITKFCIHPKIWYAEKQRIGGTKKLNIDIIIDLKPDIIIGNKEENTKEDISILEKVVPVWMSDVNTFDAALDFILDIGLLFGKIEIAKTLNAEITSGFQKLETIGQGRSVLYFIWDDPAYVVGKNTFIDAIISKLGFTNVCETERYPALSDLNDVNPDFIFLSSEPFPFSENHRKKFQELFPSSKVILVDGEMFSWYGSRMLLAIDYFQSFLK